MDTKSASFEDRCYAVVRKVPKGKVTTYREVAKALKTKAWRAVGSAMAKNKKLFVIPCHRVVRSSGHIGQYALGADKKSEILSEEGVTVSNGKVVNMEQHIHKFTS